MPVLHRVLPYLASAKAGQPGHPLFSPPATGGNRIDNPDAYDTLYLGDDAVGAVAEAFGWAARWNAGLLRGSPALPGSVQALVSYDLPDRAPLCDLDGTDRLRRLALRPSQVVTRTRSITQSWARAIFNEHRFAGVRWWSYYRPEWGSIGLWDTTELTVVQVSPLTVDHPAFLAAALEIVRVIE